MKKFVPPKIVVPEPSTLDYAQGNYTNLRKKRNPRVALTVSGILAGITFIYIIFSVIYWHSELPDSAFFFVVILCPIALATSLAGAIIALMQFGASWPHITPARILAFLNIITFVMLLGWAWFLLKAIAAIALLGGRS